MSESPSPVLGAAPPDSGGPSTEEGKLSAHKIIVSAGAGPRELDLLHRDLFDSRPAVVLSALAAVGTIAHATSYRFVGRLLGSDNKSIRIEAIRAIGHFKSPGVVKVLSNLYKMSQDEEVRAETLTALAEAAPTSPDVQALIREQATSNLATAELRGTAAVLILKLEGPERLSEILSSANAEIVERVLGVAHENPRLASAIAKQGLIWYDRFLPANRKLLVTAAGLSDEPESAGILLRGIGDEDAEVRYSAYRALGTHPSITGELPALVERLFDQVESDHQLEEEVLAAIERLEQICVGQSVSIPPSTMSRLRSRSMEHFTFLSAPVNRVGSETIELGWLILRSREYIEYYASDEFRKTLVHYLKGGSYHTMDQMLSMLKRTAERVEVKHFDGYRALGEVIKNPNRPGMALITRDLSIAKLGKRVPFGKLIRNLRLMRLSSSAGSDTVDLATRIFTWAKGEKLFRLAEASLLVVAKFASEQALSFCRGLLTPPIESKILTIAAIRLAAPLGAENLDREIERLMQQSNDSHILLNLLDALPATGLNEDPAIVTATIRLLHSGEDNEVVRQAARLLSSTTTPSLFENMTAGYERREEWRQEIILGATDRIIEEKRTTNLEGLAEFLYKILRDRSSGLRGDAAVLLWKLGDDFALKVLDRFLRAGDVELKTKIIRKLKGYVNKPLATSLLSLIDTEHAGLQEALRETLDAVVDITIAGYIREQIARREDDGDEGLDGEASDEGDLEAGIVTEKQAYRFEHEFMDDLAIFFTDIQGYSRKASMLTTMQLTSLIHDYEGILLPTVSAHRGTLIKKMGDGHLFIFESPLDAGLAALRLQKALKRFNSYREENFRVIVRVGIHWGQVVRRDGDVLGNHVNIASRLESNAKGGSILVSETLFNRLEGRIHARELGKITVKNIPDPIKVYEPYEIQIDFPPELDPLKNKNRKLSSGADQPESSAAPEEKEAKPAAQARGGLDAATIKILTETFTALDALCRRVERNEAPVTELRRELRVGWGRIRERAKELRGGS